MAAIVHGNRELRLRAGRSITSRSGGDARGMHDRHSVSGRPGIAPGTRWPHLLHGTHGLTDPL